MAVGEQYPGLQKWYSSEVARIDELADRLLIYLDADGKITPETQASVDGAEVVNSLGEVKGARDVLASLATFAGLEDLPEVH